MIRNWTEASAELKRLIIRAEKTFRSEEEPSNEHLHILSDLLDFLAIIHPEAIPTEEECR